MGNTKDERLSDSIEALLPALRVSFEELFDLDEIQRVQDGFAAASGVASIITTPEGRPLTRPSNFRRLCSDLVQASAAGREHCAMARARLAEDPRSHAPRRCSACGLWHASAQIRVGAHHVATWVVGQVRSDPRELRDAATYARRLELDERHFATAFEAVPQMRLERFGDVVTTLKLTANLLSQMAYQNVRQAAHIDALRLARNELRRQRQVAEDVVAQSPALIAGMTPDGLTTFINPAGERITGYAPAEIVGRSWWDVLCPGALSAQVDGLFEKLVHGPVRDFEMTITTRSGEQRIVAWNSITRRDESGRTVELIGFGLDVTERHRSAHERHRIAEQLRHAQKMEAVGQLAGGVAHDFNNVLTAILGQARVVELELELEDGRDGALEGTARIIQACNRGARLARRLLTFARKSPVERLPIDGHAVIDETLSLLSRSVDKRIRIERHLDAERCVVLADAAQLENALINLGLNARDAMPDGGRFVVATRTVALDAELCRSYSNEVQPGDYLEIEAADSGVGMSPEIQEHVFEPFFTTKHKGKGTGLGLATVYGIVKSHEGMVRLYSQPGEGTSFTLYLPLAETDAHTPSASQHPPEDLPTGTGHVLVVDDEALVREMIVGCLRRLGYTVSTCGNGAEAVEFYRRNRDDIALVLLDMMMPEMAGDEAFRAIRADDPNARILLTSGFSTNRTIDALMREGALGFLRKPFGLRELAAALATHARKPA